MQTALRGFLGPACGTLRGQKVTLAVAVHRRASRRAMAAAASAAPPVVSPQWLAERLGRPDVKVLDASWYMPAMGRDRFAEHKAERIPGARFWDIDGVCDHSTDLPHMLPSEGAFAAAADALGVGNGDTVVIYDGMGLFSAPRAWWTWKVFGHESVAVLEGGLPAWKAAGLELESAPVSEDDLAASQRAARAAGAGGGAKYKASLRRDKVRSMAQVRDLVDATAAGAVDGWASAGEQLADARPAGRFKGVDPEPRPGLRGGHMPGARSVPFPQVYVDGQMAGARLKSPEQLLATFSAAGIDASRPVVCTCGSGLTACVLALALHTATGGAVLPAVYDGSWSEWGAYPDTPVATE